MQAVLALRPEIAHGWEISVNTDNIASAWALESGRCSDPVLGMCARELWLVAALNSCTITVHHKPGVELILADALSRAHLLTKAATVVAEHCAHRHLKRVRVCHSENIFTCNL